MREIQGRGRFQATREDFGFIRPDEGGPDLYVPADETGGALHEDWVEYRVVGRARIGRQAEAQVTTILERGIRHLTGVVAGSTRLPVLVPDHPRLPPTLRLIGSLSGLEKGQRVLCRLQESGGRRGPAAFLESILGDADDPALDTAMVTVQFGLPGAYPQEAADEALEARRRLEAEPFEGRRDFQKEPTFTIDPADARDFDDAVSVRRDGDGWRLRVHIADVAAAVQPGGALDAEARRRGNSSYFPGSMIPMLPEVLSTGLMSLSPGEPKRVISISARIAPDGRVRGARVDEGVIRSSARLNYEQVQEVLDGRESLEPQMQAIVFQADRLAQLLRRRRMAGGAFDLDVPEADITLSEDGRPVEIRRRQGGRSHQIIEEFMILANRITCHHARSRGHPFLFRVHDPPDPIALDEFREKLPFLAPNAVAGDIADLRGLRRWLAGLPAGLRTWRIHALFLRAMERAVYSDIDRGHFGLGLRGYGHFTSPIRRYPDLFNHRVIKWGLRHGRRPVPESWALEAAALATACSATEQRSEAAERELARVKTLRWAAERVGEIFRGQVVAAGTRVAVVELDAVPVEGIVPSWEQMAQRSPARRGSGRRAPAALGEPVIVQIARVSLRERAIILALRAVGRRAMETDPCELESLADPFAAPPRKGRKRAAGGSSGKGRSDSSSGNRGRGASGRRQRKGAVRKRGPAGLRRAGRAKPRSRRGRR